MSIIKKYWKLAGVILTGIIIFILRLLWVHKDERNKDTNILRLGIDHLEAEKNAIKNNIQKSKDRVKKLKEKYSRAIKCVIIILLLPVFLQAYFPVWVDGEWRDYYNCTNAIDFFSQTKSEQDYQISEYDKLVRTQSNEILVLKTIIEMERPSKLENFVSRWLPPVCFCLGVMIGININK